VSASIFYLAELKALAEWLNAIHESWENIDWLDASVVGDPAPRYRPGRGAYGLERCPFCGQWQHVPNQGATCKRCGGDVLNQDVL